ncbi:response regulator [Sphingomonas sp. M1-B02]|uniref:response regulator n=1 Tax=Sphingomonas sp. M1-B02 TaxID=3114300 RepID=UPI0022409E00|nr:response regulator [Sphingomonas sp. S6-11]UZK67780.1 response regulator [Sphingomonas sp. S6-11]
MCHVLIIEDEWLIADYLSYLAERAGGTSIVIACTEDEAVLSAHERLPDIILSDVNLFAGTGPHAVQTIMSDLGKIPVIFITGSPEACEPCEPPGVILIKPIDPVCVMDTFRRLAHL